MDRASECGVPDGFRGMPDEVVALHARDGSEEAAEHLLSKYRSLVEGKARSYFLAGADHEDVVQEGMIGLYKAIRDFRSDRLSRFRAFAELCVTRQIITAVKTATRQKHIPLNRYVSLHGTPPDGESEGSLIDVIPDSCVADPEHVVVDMQAQDFFRGGEYDELSDLESRVLRWYLEGMSYREMAAMLTCRTKSVDNALQRVKGKIGRHIGGD